jgi:hypothetical protein
VRLTLNKVGESLELLNCLRSRWTLGRPHRPSLPLRYRYVPRLLPHPLEPSPDGGEAIEVEASFMGDVGVGVEGDVG